MDYKTQLTLEKNFKIRIKSNHDSYVKTMKDEFSYHVKNYFWMGKYKAGLWDGKVNFITEASLMPYGLLLDFLRTHKKLFPDVKLEPDEGVKNLFKGYPSDMKFDISLYQRTYQ